MPLSDRLFRGSGSVPDLTKHQLFQSHLVNCKICAKYSEAQIIEVEKGIWEKRTVPKEHRFLCPVGVKLLNEALKEDPNKSPFRPKSFPYIAKMYEVVRVRLKGSTEWVQAKVIDRSIASAGTVMGYEVEIVTPPKFKGTLERKEQFYVNPSNIKPLKTWKEKQEENKPKETFNYKPGHFKIHIGGKHEN